MKPGVRMGIDIFNFSRSQTSTASRPGVSPAFQAFPSPYRCLRTWWRNGNLVEVRRRVAPDPSPLVTPANCNETVNIGEDCLEGPRHARLQETRRAQDEFIFGYMRAAARVRP